MTTGFVTAYGGATNDLDSIFHHGGTGQNTGFVSEYLGMDLGSRFDPLDAGARLPYNTGFVALDGRDLADWFCAAGTRIPDWPVGGGFMLYQPGVERPIDGTFSALVGRMSWIINGNGTDAANTNLMADPFNVCPGVAALNAGLWQDYGGYVRNVTRRLPLGSILRIEYLTLNLVGSVVLEYTVAGGEQIPGWFSIHSGQINFCSNVSPFFNDPMNINGFAPAPGTFYASVCPYLSVTNSRNWQLVVSAGFGCHISTPHLSEHRIYITRIA